MYGRVLNSKNEVVKSATLRIDNQHQALQTSEAGDFYFLLTEGSHTITIEAEGQFACYSSITTVTLKFLRGGTVPLFCIFTFIAKI